MFPTMEEMLSEDRLWAGVRSGDPHAFEVLFERYADFVYNFAFRRTGNWDAAQEVVSTVFLEAWRQRRHVVTRDGSIRPWLIGVALNLIRHHWRNAERRKRATSRLAADHQVHPDHAGEVSDRLDAEAQMARILTVLDDLPITQREVLELWAWEGLGYEDIGALLGIPPGTVRSRLHRARERLQQQGTQHRRRASTGEISPDSVVDCRVDGKGAPT